MKMVVALGVLAAGLAAYGGLRTNDYSWVRGTHYGLVGDAGQVARELGYGRRVGLNAVRFWLSRGAWKKDPKGYAESVRKFVRIAWKNGYWSMPILFNGNMIDPKMLDEESWSSCAAYAKDIVETAASRGRTPTTWRWRRASATRWAGSCSATSSAGGATANTACSIRTVRCAIHPRSRR